MLSTICNNIIECNKEYINYDVLYEVIFENDTDIQKMYEKTDFMPEYFNLNKDLERINIINYYESGTLHTLGVFNDNHNITVSLPTSKTCKAILDIDIDDRTKMVLKQILDISKIPYREKGNRFYVLDSRYNSLFWQSVKLLIK